MKNIKIHIPDYILKELREDDKELQNEIDNILFCIDALDTALLKMKTKEDYEIFAYEPFEDQIIMTESTEVEVEIDEDYTHMMDRIIDTCHMEEIELNYVLWIELIEDVIFKIDEINHTMKHPFVAETDNYSNIISHCLWAELLQEQLKWEEERLGG
jgi:hypothetical protein